MKGPDLMLRTNLMTMTMCAALAASHNVGAPGSASQTQATAQSQGKTSQRARQHAAPTPEQRARLAEMVKQDNARLAKKASEIAASIELERSAFRRRRASELAQRNASTRTQLADRMRDADSPPARAEARRMEIRAEAVELLKRSQSASAAEREQIETRAAELLAEVERLPR